MSTLPLACLGVAALGLLVGVVFAARVVVAAHRDRLEMERARGHRKLRARMANLAGRDKDTYETVLRAETMYGWVWIVTTRRRMLFTETVEWAPTRRLARRGLNRHLASL